MRIAVVIPSYKVQSHVLDVIARVPHRVERIYVIDDECPQHSGLFVQEQCTDSRVRVIFHKENQGVGGGHGRGLLQCLAGSAGVFSGVSALPCSR